VVTGAPGVVVIGSGAAGLAAALAASTGGGDVLVLERSVLAGGTTAISGGIVWAPGNHLMSEAGIADSESEALRYLARIDRNGDTGLSAAFVSDAPRVVRLLEERTALRWKMLGDWPDYRSEEPGGSAGGRSLWPAPLELPAELARRLQASPEDYADPDPKEILDPTNDGVVLRGPVRGRVLVGGLLSALESNGVEVRLGARATSLVTDRGRVTGVEVDGENLRARVIIASGGFQHDPGLVSSFLRATPIAAMGPPGCAGDGLRMSIAVGASLANMAEGWWMPAMHANGEDLGGSRFYRPLHSERAQPGSLMVDRSGRRFVNESLNYGDVGRAMQRYVPQPDWYPSLPSWLVFDSHYRARTPIGPLLPADPDPGWLVRARSIRELATLIESDPDVLCATVECFNRHATEGRDPDFGRGDGRYDKWIGDRNAPHPTLGALEEAPFYALRVHCGCMGTKGGPRTDDNGRVMGIGGDVIEGLYAAGNAAANPFGIATPAGGATLGPALVFGTRAGEAAVRDP
jgi:3-oxosteroid 1-dehydrogenase